MVSYVGHFNGNYIISKFDKLYGSYIFKKERLTGKFLRNQRFSISVKVYFSKNYKYSVTQVGL
jgi:hypothetical protein